MTVYSDERKATCTVVKGRVTERKLQRKEQVPLALDVFLSLAVAKLYKYILKNNCAQDKELIYTVHAFILYKHINTFTLYAHCIFSL